VTNWLTLGVTIVTLFVAGITAWQNQSIHSAILQLKLDLIERISRTEGDVKVLQTKTDRGEDDVRALEDTLAMMRGTDGCTLNAAQRSNNGNGWHR
jgi:hypothetical protein